MTARQARLIRRSSQRRSQYRDGLGVSELFLADAAAARQILAVTDIRLKCYLLGFSTIPHQSSRCESD
jgi:hypothetical protein